MDDDLFDYIQPARALSPCVNVCDLDARTGWCIGCGRTGDEIAVWTSVDDAGRQAILDRLPMRMAALRDVLNRHSGENGKPSPAA